jgi:hypothetical protein
MTWIIGIYTIKQIGPRSYMIFINGRPVMQAQAFTVALMFVLDEQKKPSENFRNAYNPPTETIDPEPISIPKRNSDNA